MIGVAGLATNYEALWNWVDVPDDLRAPLSSGLSLLTVVIGFMIGFYLQQIDMNRTMQAEILSLANDLRRTIPDITLFSSYTGEEALYRVATQLPLARVVLNTRVFNGEYNFMDNPAQDHWNRAIRNSVVGGVTFREVVSHGNVDLVQARARATAGGRGQYSYSIITYPLPSFCNFIILEYLDGTREIWFGWIISHGMGFEGNVVRTSETHIIDLFSHWHRELFAYGKVSPVP